MSEEIIYKPREIFNGQLKQGFHNEAEKFYDEMAEKGELNKDANKTHVAKYDAENGTLKNLQTNRSGKGSARGWLIALGILLILGGIVMIVVGILMISQPGLFALIIGGAAAIAFSLVVFFVFVRKLSKEIKSLDERISKQQKVVNEALRICYEDMAGLNKLLDWNMPAKVMKSVTPILQLDDYFTNERLAMLKENYGLWDDDNEDSSTIGVLSGEIKGNPFLLQRCLVMELRPKIYTGTLVIHWTTTVSDGKGGTRTVTHTQTLTATVTEPAPVYETVTCLLYGNEAAPHLSFSRVPYGADSMDEKAQRKAAEKGAKDLKKLAERDLKKGKEHVFTPMGNDKFDVFFGATDRDNEVEFRLLFTPLAQTNMVDLLTNKEPFGDDFHFIKKKKINIISSKHSQIFEYFVSPDYFISHSYELGKEKFVSYCDSFIKNLYFDFAPLMSIPLYQMHKSHEFIYRDDKPSNYPIFEHEVLANFLDKVNFIPKDADPSLPVILKSKKTRRMEGLDNVTIHSGSFQTFERVTLVPVHGGDGRLHSVPVHWIEYDRVYQDFGINVAHVDGSKKQFDLNSSSFKNYKFQRGYIAGMADKDSKFDTSKLNTIFNKK